MTGNLRQLNTILDETRERFRVLREQQKQETDEVTRKHTEKVREMLKPEQLSEYREIQGRARPENQGTGRKRKSCQRAGR